MDDSLTRSTDLPVALDDLKEHLHILSSSEDTILTAYLWAAIGWAEEILSRVIGQTNVVYTTSYDTLIRLRSPLVSITSVTYPGESGTVTIDPADYRKIRVNDVPYLEFVTEPDVDDLDALELTITYVCGFVTADFDSPEWAGIKAAILIKAASLYQIKEESEDLSFSTAERLLQSKRLQYL